MSKGSDYNSIKKIKCNGREYNWSNPRLAKKCRWQQIVVLYFLYLGALKVVENIWRLVLAMGALRDCRAVKFDSCNNL